MTLVAKPKDISVAHVQVLHTSPTITSQTDSYIVNNAQMGILISFPNKLPSTIQTDP